MSVSSDIDESIPLLTEEIAFGKQRHPEDDIPTRPGPMVEDEDDDIPTLASPVPLVAPPPRAEEAEPPAAPTARAPAPPYVPPVAAPYVASPVVAADAALPQQGVQHGTTHFGTQRVQTAEPDWDALANEVRERVLRDLHDRVDYALEARIVETVSAGLQLALRDMTAQLHQSLRDTLRELVTSAVAQEIQQLRSERFQQGELEI